MTEQCCGLCGHLFTHGYEPRAHRTYRCAAPLHLPEWLDGLWLRTFDPQRRIYDGKSCARFVRRTETLLANPREVHTAALIATKARRTAA